ncbi:MAG TPA: hypothetical protein VK433_08245, partial [Stellaceae bacterium]|nr:hypothetical protein [Stellaceae bacterium]
MEVNLGRYFYDARRHRATRQLYDTFDTVPARERATVGAIAAAWAVAGLALGIMIGVELTSPEASPFQRQAQLHLENCP